MRKFTQKNPRKQKSSTLSAWGHKFEKTPGGAWEIGLPRYRIDSVELFLIRSPTVFLCELLEKTLQRPDLAARSDMILARL